MAYLNRRKKMKKDQPDPSSVRYEEMQRVIAENRQNKDACARLSIMAAKAIRSRNRWQIAFVLLFAYAIGISISFVSTTGLLDRFLTYVLGL